MLVLGGAGAVLGTETGRRYVTDLSRRGRRLTTTSLDADGKIPVPPTELAAAVSTLLDRQVTATAYGLARMMRSEEGSAAPAVKRLLGWVAINDAAELRWNLLRTLTYSTKASRLGFFGEQISRRYSTARDPYENDLAIAEKVLDEYARNLGDPTGGAVKFVNVSAFGVQKGTTSYQAVVDRWAKDGLEPFRIAGAPDNLRFFRRIGRVA